MIEPDLFGNSTPGGLFYVPDLVAKGEEADLIARLNQEPLTPFRFQNWTGKRQTISYGWHYDFESGRFAPTLPMPSWLEPLRERAAQASGLAASLLVQALLIRYDPGASIGWHRDRPVFADVIGISLGASATLRLRRRTASGFERSAQPLDPRSLYRLSGPARHLWEHSIPPLDRLRWSITFRTLSTK